MSESHFFQVLIDIAAHAAFADGVLQVEEKEIIERTAKGFNLNYKVPESPSKLPSLKLLVSRIDSKSKLIKVIDFAFHIIVANGDCTIEEQDFMIKLCRELKVEDKNLISKIVSFMVDSSAKQLEWNNLKASLHQLTQQT